MKRGLTPTRHVEPSVSLTVTAPNGQPQNTYEQISTNKQHGISTLSNASILLEKKAYKGKLDFLHHSQ